MNPFEMVVVVVFLLTVGSIVSSLTKGHEEKKAKKERKESDDRSFREADELRDLILRLEDRIRVLERIVTDTNGREDLRRQFRDLER